jgi:hypothetical protein
MTTAAVRTPARDAFDHVLAMTDSIGTFEHADHAEPRVSHGYCADDMARVLIVVCREHDPDQELLQLGRTAFRFLTEAQGVTGRIRNRRNAKGRWNGPRSVDDCWGRSVWAFGTAAHLAPEARMRESAMAYFEHGLESRSLWPRAMAFAALGAAEVLAVEPKHYGARRLLADAVATIGPIADDPEWPWPEARLSYANAALPDALLAAGLWLSRPELVEDAMTMLRWLLARETVDGHLSPSPVGGADRDDHPPAFDQQPIEVAAMADACARAVRLTGEAEWRRGLVQAIGWFEGDNDAGATMWDPTTGGAYDGLEATGPNLNQGAESALALISTRQHARTLVSTTR